MTGTICISWQRVDLDGKPVGRASKWHAAYRVRTGDLMTYCAVFCRPRKDGFFGHYGEYSNPLKVSVLECEQPTDNLCRVCYPPVPRELPTPSLFDLDEREEAGLFG